MAALITEINVKGSASTDYVEVRVDAGDDISNLQIFVYGKANTANEGKVIATIDVNSVSPTTVGGYEYYVVYTGIHINDGLALADNGVLIDFYSFKASGYTATEGPASGQTATSLGQQSGTNTYQTGDGGTWTQEPPTPGGPLCFTPGCMISTPLGAVPVEELSVGSLVNTLDHGIQAVRWIGRMEMTGTRLFAMQQYMPVKILAGALGQGMPERDMCVSPQHRVLISDPQLQLKFGLDVALTPALGLLHVDGIDLVALGGVSKVTYIHLMFDQHELVLSDGIWTESFYPGDVALDALSSAVREEVLALFPELAHAAPNTGFGQIIRPCLRPWEMRMLHCPQAPRGARL